MRKIVIKNTTEKVTTLNKETLSLLKRNILSNEFLFELVEESTVQEANIKIAQHVQKRITKRYPNLQKVAPLVFERYNEILQEHILRKVEECCMPSFL